MSKTTALSADDPRELRRQKARRRQIVKAYKKYPSVVAVAKEMKTTEAEIHSSLRQEGIQPKHADRYEYRKVIAEEVRKTGDLRAVAKKYRVTEFYVRNGCCKEHGVLVKRAGYKEPRVSGVTLKIMADLLNGQRQQALSDKYNVTRQWISLIKKRAEKAGFKFPPAKKTRRPRTKKT
ncbi:MAG: hypothetical protein K8T91_09630 [Planctomycetes bacterium]|nr:hypothetical protein [Planctomycetota bacterium]